MYDENTFYPNFKRLIMITGLCFDLLMQLNKSNSNELIKVKRINYILSLYAFAII